MVNYNDDFSSSANGSTFYNKLPIYRKKDRDYLMVDTPVAAFERFEAWVQDGMHWQLDRHRHLEFLTTLPDIQTFGSAKKMNRAARDGQETRTAQLAKDIVNHKDFDGTVRLDGHLLGMDELNGAVKASALENSWSAEDWAEKSKWIVGSVTITLTISIIMPNQPSEL